ncbi:MAG: hypothetical protein H6573_22540 [Lewinellaceae bacterium]|nr:hypothetical protein [Phaeodactylibacter sp.]MCB9350265.1 hypothetical protein [Lewinellaceae bacterium]
MRITTISICYTDIRWPIAFPLHSLKLWPGNQRQGLLVIAPSFSPAEQTHYDNYRRDNL